MVYCHSPRRALECTVVLTDIIAQNEDGGNYKLAGFVYCL